MDAALSDDQQLLVATAARLAEDIGDPAPTALPTHEDDAPGWAALAGTGLLAMHLPEPAGGGGAHSADVALVVEQLGRRTCLAPYLGQGVMAPELAYRAGAPPELLAGMADGSARVTVAVSADLRGLARPGQEAIAWDARGATHALARGADNRMALVPLDGEVLPQADVTRVLRRIDPAAGGEPLGEPIPDGAAARAEAYLLAMVGADLVGVMQGALDAAVAHVRTRTQFGVPVGTFQAVQHLAADAAVLVEGSRSALWYAAWAADELDPAAALLAAHQLKAYACSAALQVVEIQTQLLGGIALTWEERAHLRVRRALLDRLVFGDEDAHLDAVAGIRLSGAA